LWLKIPPAPQSLILCVSKKVLKNRKHVKSLPTFTVNILELHTIQKFKKLQSYNFVVFPLLYILEKTSIHKITISIKIFSFYDIHKKAGRLLLDLLL
jgi:hypothetical protein